MFHYSKEIDAFFKPLYMLLAYLYSYTLVRASNLKRWQYYLFAIPFITLFFCIFIYHILDSSIPGWSILRAVLWTSVGVITFGGDLFLLVYGIKNIRYLKGKVENYIANGQDAIKPIIKQYSHAYITFIIMQIPVFITLVVREEYVNIFCVIWAVCYSLYLMYLCRLVLRGFNSIEMSSRDIQHAENSKNQLIKEALENNFTEDLSKEIIEELDEEIHYLQDRIEMQPADKIMTSEGKRMVQELVAEDRSNTKEKTSIAKNEETADKKQKTDTDETKIARSKQIERYINEKNIPEMLQKLMIEKKIYLQPNITIAQVAKELGTNNAYLSMYLNEILNINFTDYINTLRIHNEVLPRIESNPEISAQDLIYTSGFNHPATFYRAFQKITGQSFPAYKKNLSSK
ncbi:MAG: helix-turn-helix domain-containing protein [Paludibacteraceae bacterium]|nr:helix-turn-helix domain-containing protein [Paludibacteraceae bacterium]